MKLRPLSTTVSSSSDGRHMLNKVCLSGEKWQKTVFVIVLCLGIFGGPEISYKWVELNEVWTGSATCNEITI